jgi:tRNA A64-2'-O-ribosylphosphate transferase
VIVDSTRRGKSMPDALSKTVPIWCCVMNRAIFPEDGPHNLYTSPQSVSASEHAQIEKRIDGFVKQFCEICAPNITELQQKLKKPLRPLWITQSSSLPDEPPAYTDFHPIVLCTASRRIHGNEGSEDGYIQGAADDQEAWSHGLTSKLFWSNKEKIINTNENELPNLIAQFVREEKGPGAVPILVKPTTNVFVSSSQNLDIEPFSIIISCTPEALTTTEPDHLKKRYLHLPCGIGKLGSRDLRTHLPLLATFITSLPDEIGNILICCPTGKDLSVGMALVILCLYADDKGTVSKGGNGKKIDKKFIKQRLTWLTTTSPILNPSRGTLQSVNAFLMPDPYSSTKGFSTPNPYPKSQLNLVDANGQPVSTPLASTPAVSTTKPSACNHEHVNSPRPSLSSTLFTNISTTTKPWIFTRTLTSSLPPNPSGTVTGTTTITPFPSPCSSTTKTVDCPATTLLFAEEGEFVTTTGDKFPAPRKYIYKLQKQEEDDEQEAQISIHFYDEDKEDGIGGLFVEMGKLTEEEGGGVWTARNVETHHCGEDMYSASWRVGGEMLGGAVTGKRGEKWWEVTYDVVGPRKRYVSETRYTLA